MNIAWRGGTLLRGLVWGLIPVKLILWSIKSLWSFFLHCTVCSVQKRTELAASTSWSIQINGAVQRHQFSFFESQHSPGAMYVIYQALRVGPCCFVLPGTGSSGVVLLFFITRCGCALSSTGNLRRTRFVKQLTSAHTQRHRGTTTQPLVHHRYLHMFCLSLPPWTQAVARAFVPVLLDFY